MIRLTDAEYLGNFRVRLEFSDGASGIADFQDRLDGPIFKPLNDPDAFGRFELTDHTLQWPNGADFARVSARLDLPNRAYKNTGFDETSAYE